MGIEVNAQLQDSEYIAAVHRYGSGYFKNNYYHIWIKCNSLGLFVGSRRS